MLLKDVPSWMKVEKTIEFMCEKGQQLEESVVFDQYSLLKEFVQAQVVDENSGWESKSCHEKWRLFFNLYQKE